MLTQKKMDIIATYMDDDRREYLHSKLAPCRPEEFLAAYCKMEEIETGEDEFEELIYNEFGIDFWDDIYPELTEEEKEEICKTLGLVRY
jgi:hypothetical protein